MTLWGSFSPLTLHSDASGETRIELSHCAAEAPAGIEPANSGFAELHSGLPPGYAWPPVARNDSE